MAESTFTILDRPYAYLVGRLISGLRAAELNPLIVGGLAAQLNTVESYARQKGQWDFREQDADLAEFVPDMPIRIRADGVASLKPMLRPTHDLDLCFPEEEREGIIDGFIHLPGSAGIGAILNASEGKAKIHGHYGRKQEPVSISVDFNMGAEDSHARSHRSVAAYNETFKGARAVYLAQGNETHYFQFARPEVVVAAKLVRGKAKDQEDVKNLRKSDPKIDLAEVHRILSESGESDKIESLV